MKFINELLSKEIIYKAVGSNQYFINVTLFFNGDRVNILHSYKLKKQGSGVYIMVIEGSVFIDGQELNKRDAIGITDASTISLKAINHAEILLMEVPMEF